MEIKKPRRLFLFKPDNIVIKTLEDTTKIDGFNKHLQMRQYNNWFTYSGPHRHEDDNINTFVYYVCAQDGTTAIELIFGTKTLLTDVYDKGSKSGFKISKFLQDLFCEKGIPINIWSDNAQETFMGSVSNIFCAYGVGIKPYKSHK